MNIYHYTFYKIYKSTEKYNASPEIVAAGFFSIMLTLNIFTIVIYYNIDFISNKILFFGIPFSVLLINTKYFNSKNSNRIIKKYRIHKSIILDMVIFLYPIVTLFLFLLSLEADSMTIIFAVVASLIVEIIILIAD